MGAAARVQWRSSSRYRLAGAHRHDDGEWFPGPDCQQEEAAS